MSGYYNFLIIMNGIFFFEFFQMIDVGENIIIFDDFIEKEMKMGIWKINLMVGVMAGVVLRSCIVLLDRIKVMLQVYFYFMLFRKFVLFLVDMLNVYDFDL